MHLISYHVSFVIGKYKFSPKSNDLKIKKQTKLPSNFIEKKRKKGFSL